MLRKEKINHQQGKKINGPGTGNGSHRFGSGSKKLGFRHL